MASETFHRRILVTSDPETCWKTLTNVELLVSWVTVIHEAHEIAPLERYTAVLQDRLGPLKLRAPLEVEVMDIEEGRQIRVKAAGRDSQVNSQINVDVTLMLELTVEGTALDVTGSFSVTGRVASMGGGIIRKKADHILEEFFTQASQALGPRSE
jgi:carbon monoxide dehydrogenase subunit G